MEGKRKIRQQEGWWKQSPCHYPAQLEETHKERAGPMQRQEGSWGALAVTERHRKDLPKQLPLREAPAETEEQARPQSACRTSLLLPVSHLLYGVKVMAHIESSQVAEIRKTQVEVEHFLFVTLHLHRHTNGRVFSLLHQSQVFQQTSSFLLARAKKNFDPCLDQG